MTPSNLKYHYEQNNVDNFYFSRSSMKFLGDFMKNYGVRSAKLLVEYDDEGNYMNGEKKIVDIWELYRKRPVKHGVKTSAYFCKTTFKIRHGELVVD